MPASLRSFGTLKPILANEPCVTTPSVLIVTWALACADHSPPISTAAATPAVTRRPNLLTAMSSCLGRPCAPNVQVAGSRDAVPDRRAWRRARQPGTALAGRRALATAPTAAMAMLSRNTGVNEPAASAIRPPTCGAAIWATPNASVAAL